MAQATNTQLGEIQLAGDLAGNGGAQIGTNPQLSHIPGLVPGQYVIPRITVDSKGRIVEIQNGSSDIADILPAATATTPGVVSIGENIFVTDGSEPAFWTVNYGGSIASSATETGLANQSCAMFSFSLSVDNGPFVTVSLAGSSVQTFGQLISQINSRALGVTAGLVDGNFVLVSGTQGSASRVILDQPGLFSCCNGFVSAGSETRGVGSCEIYVKRASELDYGVVKIGAGLAVEDGVISFDSSTLTTATATNLGVVSVPVSGGLTVTNEGALSVPVATTSARGVVQVGAGLSVTGAGVLSVDSTTLPAATTSARGVVQVGAGLAVTETGVLSLDPTNLPVATTSARGAVQVGAGLSVTGAGVLSMAPATSTDIGGVRIGTGLTVDATGLVQMVRATDSVLGGVIAGEGINIAGDGTISAAAIPDASFTTRGVVQFDANSGFTVSAGVAGIARATDTTLGVIRVGNGLTASEGVLSVRTASTGNVGAVRIGAGISINSGVISTTTIPTASTTVAGIARIKAASGLIVGAGGEISAAVASSSTLGVVQVGNNLTVTNGVISVPVATPLIPGVVTVDTDGGLEFVSGTPGAIRVSADVARKNVPNAFTAVQGYAVYTSTGATTITLPTTHNVYDIEFGAASTVTIIQSGTGLGTTSVPQVVKLRWLSGTNSITFPSGWYVSGYVAPAGAAGSAVISGHYIGSAFFAQWVPVVS